MNLSTKIIAKKEYRKELWEERKLLRSQRKLAHLSYRIIVFRDKVSTILRKMKLVSICIVLFLYFRSIIMAPDSCSLVKFLLDPFSKEDILLDDNSGPDKQFFNDRTTFTISHFFT